MNPFDALASFVLGKIKEGLYAQWLKFLFEMGFSAIVSFLFICGGLMAAKTPASIAIGTGMVMAAIALTTLFRREKNKLTKGMLVVLPSAEAAQELDTNLQTIQKS